MRDGEGIETFYNGEKYVGAYREDNKEGQVGNKREGNYDRPTGQPTNRPIHGHEG